MKLSLLLDNSILLVFLTTMTFLAFMHVRAEMKRLDLSFIEYLRGLWQFEIKPRLEMMLPRMLGITILTFLSSFILFGQLWVSDAFHIILFCVLIQGQVKKLVNYLLD